MKTLLRLGGLIAGLLLCPMAPADVTNERITPSLDPVGSLLETNSYAVSVLEKKNIYVEVAGSIDVKFATALRALKQEDLLGQIESAWEATQNEEIYFKINQEDDVTYSYIDRKGHPTTIIEIGRFFTTRADGKQQLDMLFYSKGKRFFGHFEAISKMTAWPSDTEGETTYSSCVYAYPKNGFSRFFARHLGLVDRFFRKETKVIEDYAADISRYIASAIDVEPESHTPTGSLTP